MPGQNQRQELIVVNLIQKLQTKVETLSGVFDTDTPSHINDYAFNELSKMNAELHNSVKNEFLRLYKENDALRQQIAGLTDITNELTGSNWYKKNNPDFEYICRQVKTRAEKQGDPNCKQCECGEWVSKGFFSQHKKRAKCVDSLMRLWYDKNNYKIAIDKMLLFNQLWVQRIHYKFNKKGSYHPRGIQALQYLMLKKYLRRKGMLKFRYQLHGYFYRTRGNAPNFSFIF
jgi:hypothetical protein